MSNALIPCPSCARHVRSSEASCPFCSTLLPVGVRGAVQRALPKARLGRAAMFAFGAAALTVTAAACGDDDDTTPPVDLGADTSTPQDMGSPDDMGTPDDMGPAEDMGTEEDLGGIAPAYGLPADAGAQDAGEPDMGGAAPLYGLPPGA